jgi:hypothetical protein
MEMIIEDINKQTEIEELRRRYRRYDNIVYEERIAEYIKHDIKFLKLHVQSRIFELTNYKDGEFI